MTTLRPKLFDAIRSLLPQITAAVPKAVTQKPTGPASGRDQFVGSPSSVFGNVTEPAAMVAEASAGAMSDDQLARLAESPIGQQSLAGLKAALQGGQLTPARQKQLDRVNAAAFVPGPGLKIEGSDADQQAFCG